MFADVTVKNRYDVGAAALRGRPQALAIIGRAGDHTGSPLRADGFFHTFSVIGGAWIHHVDTEDTEIHCLLSEISVSPW